MRGTASLLWMSSVGATDPNIFPHLRGYIILQQGRRHLGWCRTCPTPIGIRRVDTFFSKGRTRYVVGKSG